MVLRSGRTVCIRETIIARRFSGTKHEGMRPQAIPRHKLKGNAEIYFKGTYQILGMWTALIWLKMGPVMDLSFKKSGMFRHSV
jgi:hypothetical protein